MLRNKNVEMFFVIALHVVLNCNLVYATNDLVDEIKKDRAVYEAEVTSKISCEELESLGVLRTEDWNKLEVAGVDVGKLIYICRKEGKDIDTTSLKMTREIFNELYPDSKTYENKKLEETKENYDGFESELYENEHFSFLISSGWSEFSKEISNQVATDISGKLSLYKQEFITGFHEYDKKELVHPYIVVGEGGTVVSFDQLKKSLYKTEGAVSRIENKMGDDLGDFEIGLAKFDENRKLATIKTSADYDGIGRVYVLTAIFLGQKGNVYVNFYSLDENFEDVSEVFSSVRNSFQWKDDYEYIEGQKAKKSITKDVVDDGISGAITGLFLSIIIGIIIVIRSISSRIKKKSQKRTKSDL